MGRHPDRRRFRTVHPIRVVLLAVVAVTLVGLVACQPQSPEERVSELRSEYEAVLNSFAVQETPMVEESGMEMAEGGADAAMEEGMAEGAPEEAAAEGDAAGEEIVEEVPVRQDVMLDVVLRKEGSTDTLPGITLDVYQQGVDGSEKASYRFYVETDRLNKGSRQAISHVLEDVDYEEGDGFAVEVRQPVPPELYGEYKEFSDAVSGEGGE